MSPDEMAEALETLETRAQGLARLVTRFEAALEAGLTEWADVTAIAREVAQTDDRLVVEGPGRPVMATLNRTAALRILSELVENALAFSPEGETVTIRVTETSERIEVRVIDRGPGRRPGGRDPHLRAPRAGGGPLHPHPPGRGAGAEPGAAVGARDGRRRDPRRDDRRGPTFVWRVSGGPALP